MVAEDVFVFVSLGRGLSIGITYVILAFVKKRQSMISVPRMLFLVQT